MRLESKQEIFISPLRTSGEIFICPFTLPIENDSGGMITSPSEIIMMYFTMH